MRVLFKLYFECIQCAVNVTLIWPSCGIVAYLQEIFRLVERVILSAKNEKKSGLLDKKRLSKLNMNVLKQKYCGGGVLIFTLSVSSWRDHVVMQACGFAIIKTQDDAMLTMSWTAACRDIMLHWCLLIRVGLTVYMHSNVGACVNGYVVVIH